jgi:hypothetical protein
MNPAQAIKGLLLFCYTRTKVCLYPGDDVDLLERHTGVVLTRDDIIDICGAEMHAKRMFSVVVGTVFRHPQIEKLCQVSWQGWTTAVRSLEVCESESICAAMSLTEGAMPHLTKYHFPSDAFLPSEYPSPTS